MPKNTNAAQKRQWIAPIMKQLSAGDAEAISPDGNPDGGGAGNSRS